MRKDHLQRAQEPFVSSAGNTGGDGVCIQREGEQKLCGAALRAGMQSVLSVFRQGCRKRLVDSGDDPCRRVV